MLLRGWIGAAEPRTGLLELLTTWETRKAPELHDGMLVVPQSLTRKVIPEP